MITIYEIATGKPLRNVNYIYYSKALKYIDSSDTITTIASA